MTVAEMDECGVDGRGQCVLDYGPRQFLARITAEGKAFGRAMGRLQP